MARGNTLTEYVLIGSLVSLVCFIGMTTMGSDLHQLLLGARQLMSQSASAATTSPSTDSTATPDRAISTIPKPPPPGDRQTQVCFESGLCVNVPVVDPEAFTETAGSNGGQMTQLYANILQQISEQLQQSGTAEPALVNAISNLANEAHLLAQAEFSAEQNFQLYCTDEDGCLNLPPEENETNCSTYAAFIATNTQREAFLSQKQALEQLLQENPDSLPAPLRYIVELEANEILKIADTFKMDPQTSGGMSLTLGSAELTQQSANTICSQGGEKCVKHGFEEETDEPDTANDG